MKKFLFAILLTSSFAYSSEKDDLDKQLQKIEEDYLRSATESENNIRDSYNKGTFGGKSLAAAKNPPIAAYNSLDNVTYLTGIRLRQEGNKALATYVLRFAKLLITRENKS